MKEAIVKLFNESSRIKARYRDQYGFLVWGLVLAIDEENSTICIDAHHNHVMIDSVIEVKSL